MFLASLVQKKTNDENHNNNNRTNLNPDVRAAVQPSRGGIILNP